MFFVDILGELLYNYLKIVFISIGMVNMFALFKSRKRDKQSEQSLTAIYFERLDFELDKIEKAVNPRDFFTSYKIAIALCNTLLSKGLAPDKQKPILDILFALNSEKTEKTNRFLDRCSRSGQLTNSVDEIISFRTEMSDESYEIFAEMTGISERFYTYCLVSFGTEKYYYYVSELDGIMVGDKVLVPAGKENEPTVASVVNVEKCRYDFAPYPPSKTKRIISIIG